MGSLKIPRWVGPAVTPIVLILLVVVLWWYYCYWKPRRERNKQGSDIEKNATITNGVHTQRSPDYLHHHSCQSSDDTCNYTVGTYGSFYPDICPLPVSSRLDYCVPHEYIPRKVFHYPIPPRDVNRCKAAVCKTECQGLAKIKKCKVKCPRGECIKYPNLPVIMEGDSSIEEEDGQNSKVIGSEKMECNCEVKCLESGEEVVDSGYED